PSSQGVPWRLLLEIAMGVALLVLLVLVLTGPARSPQPEEPLPTEEVTPTPSPEPTPPPTPTPWIVTVRFHSPLGNSSRELEAGEEIVLESAPLEGYTFLRWRDAEGRDLDRSSLKIWEDTDLYAVYAMALGREEHAPFLSLDADGAFHPDGTLTRREVAQILYAQLDTDLVGDGRFLDVPEDDPAFLAIATLKQLGAVSGSRFHPDEEITRRELLEILCTFFPAETGEQQFSDLDEKDPAYPLFRTAAGLGWIESGEDVPARPDDPLTRLELVSILQPILDLQGDREQRRELVGTILDMSSREPLFWAVAEAVIPHTHDGRGVGEEWLSSEPLPVREEGLFFLGVKLHAIDAQGDPVYEGEYAGLRFDRDGVETSGDPELDALIWDLLETVVKPEKARPMNMLNDLFIYEVYHFRYRMGNYYPVGEPSGWEAKEAKELLTLRSGNCYSFAALYYELARAIGFDARAYTGAILGDPPEEDVVIRDVHGDLVSSPPGHIPHGWVEIEIDGVDYIFDPELAYRQTHRGLGVAGCFKMDAHERARWGYYAGDAAAPEPSPSPAPTG
ncbi:MAG: S-layer homology domain-containing protein, partial [Oscillospiraceae bacterium]|nr:S-layer homology domain-containing protein [Oscillospiraceae bacterium]